MALANHGKVYILGYNNAVDTSFGVLATSLTYAFPTVARVHAIVSADAADAAAGTGARTVLVEGVDSAWGEVSETVTLNGMTPVNTTNSYLWLRMSVATAGSGLVNAGIITATAATDATVTATIGTTATTVSNMSAEGVFLTYGGKGLKVEEVQVHSALTTATVNVRWQLQESTTYNGPYRTVAAGNSTVAGGSSQIVNVGGVWIPPNRYVRLLAASTTGTNPTYGVIRGTRSLA